MNPHPITVHITHATMHFAGVGSFLGALEQFAELPATDILSPAVNAQPGQAQSTSDTEVLRASALTPPALGELWPGQGGRYVGTVPAMLGMPARHLIASETEHQAQWGGYGSECAGAKSHVDGPGNTKALIDEGGHPAAEWAAQYRADGHSDFHLPSRLDLLMAHLQAPQAFTPEGWHWSSTQYSAHIAFVQGFQSGSSAWGDKDDTHRVRAFRWIHLTA